jgi:alpha-beta hydrolase superfamily lysophospholipase
VDIDAVILNSPYLAASGTSAIESALLSVLMKSGKSIDIEDKWYGRSIHMSERGEWNFDLNIKPVGRVRLHGSFLSAVHAVQEDLRKRRVSIKCPTLFMCSNRSIKPGKTWRDEYGEG